MEGKVSPLRCPHGLLRHLPQVPTSLLWGSGMSHHKMCLGGIEITLN